MKIYFTASLRGRKDYGANYTKIIAELAKDGNRVFSDHITKTDPALVDRQDKDEAKGVYKKLIGEIKKCDVFVAEVSTQSLSVGHEITEAITLNKPVVLLYTGGSINRPGLLFGADYEKLQIAEYGLSGGLSHLVEQVLERAREHTDVRFNFFVSPKILSYLDFVAKKRMIPRSVFLRNLIEREMKKDKYKG